ncbi:MAG: hypothetical protein ACP5TE_14350 [Verrucomicrobiia bacterium]
MDQSPKGNEDAQHGESKRVIYIVRNGPIAERQWSLFFIKRYSFLLLGDMLY